MGNLLSVSEFQSMSRMADFTESEIEKAIFEAESLVLAHANAWEVSNEVPMEIKQAVRLVVEKILTSEESEVTEERIGNYSYKKTKSEIFSPKIKTLLRNFHRKTGSINIKTDHDL